MTILGGDYSHWNSPDFPALVAAGHKFAWLKCTEGTTWIDPKYFPHRTNAVAAGLKVVAYHYFRAAWTGAGQAQHFFNTAYNDTLPPAIDVERTNNLGFTKSVFQSRLRECLLETERLFARRPIIYTSKYNWEQLVGLAGWEDEYDLWVANYTTAPQPLLPNGWLDWKVWQYTSVPLDTNRMQTSFWDALVGAPS